MRHLDGLADSLTCTCPLRTLPWRSKDVSPGQPQQPKNIQREELASKDRSRVLRWLIAFGLSGDFNVVRIPIATFALWHRDA